MRTAGRGTGQTSVDFLIGVSIFSVTLLFVLQIASGSVVDFAPETQTEDALSERTGAVVLSNWSAASDLEAGMFDEDAADEYLNDGEPVRQKLDIPDEYSYNVTVVKLENMSDEPPEPINADLTAGNATEDVTADSIAGRNRVAYMNDTDEMVGVKVKVW